MSSAWQAFAEETPETAPCHRGTPAIQAAEDLRLLQHLQWTSISDAASIARDIGFDALILRFVPEARPAER